MKVQFELLSFAALGLLSLVQVGSLSHEREGMESDKTYRRTLDTTMPSQQGAIFWERFWGR